MHLHRNQTVQNLSNSRQFVRILLSFEHDNLLDFTKRHNTEQEGTFFLESLVYQSTAYSNQTTILFLYRIFSMISPSVRLHTATMPDRLQYAV